MRYRVLKDFFNNTYRILDTSYRYTNREVSLY